MAFVPVSGLFIWLAEHTKMFLHSDVAAMEPSADATVVKRRSFQAFNRCSTAPNVERLQFEASLAAAASFPPLA
jgi:hypothetical protein